MLDRFDARWMLDPADFRKETGSNMTASVMAEVRGALHMCTKRKLAGASEFPLNRKVETSPVLHIRDEAQSLHER